MSNVPLAGPRNRLKRTGLKRTGVLKRVRLHRRHRRTRVVEVGRAEWRELPHAGYCECGCGRFSLHLHRHHVVTESHVRSEGGDPWTLANCMLLHEQCHTNQHSGFHRIPFNRVPADAVDFARRLLGEERARLYFTRFYGGSYD